MEPQAKPKVTVQPSAEERQKTLDALSNGKPVVEGGQTAPDPNPDTAQVAARIPATGVPNVSLPDEAAESDQPSSDKRNQNDGRADVLPG